MSTNRIIRIVSSKVISTSIIISAIFVIIAIILYFGFITIGTICLLLATLIVLIYYYC